MLFNGIDMTPYMRIIDIRGRGVAEQEITTIRPTGSSLDHITYVTSPSKAIEVDFEIRAADKESLRKKIEVVSAVIRTKERVPIIFNDEKDRVYYCILSGAEQISEYHHNGIHRGTLHLSREQYKYSATENNLLFPADIVVVENDGTADALPVFELEATKKVTFAMVSNQHDEYNLIGQPVDEDGHEQIVDTRSSVLYENGSTLDTWTPSTNTTDDYFIDISGSMMTDGAGIRTQSYGTGDRMHGPAIRKELSSSIQDFEIETTFDIISQRPEENFRMEVYFHDENMNMLGKLGVKDDNRSYLRRRGLGRVGEYRGSGASRGYAIGEQNYSYDDVQETTLMYLRVKREGTRYTFYIAQWRNRKHIRNITATYNDVTKQYQGKLKYITLFIGKYQDRPNPLRLRINSVEVFELAKAVEDQTPYILQPGDVVEFDHTEKDIRVNGESRKDLKNFGASFFSLEKGENRLVITPEESFRTRVRFSERFL